MSSVGHFYRNVVKEGAAQVIGASVTDTVISDEFNISDHDSLYFRARVKTSATTVAVGITVKLQTNSHKDGTWLDSKTVAVTTNGTFEIKLLPEVAGDQTFLPLLGLGRLVITTGAGDAVTIDSLHISKRP